MVAHARCQIIGLAFVLFRLCWPLVAAARRTMGDLARRVAGTPGARVIVGLRCCRRLCVAIVFPRAALGLLLFVCFALCAGCVVFCVCLETSLLLRRSA